MVRLSRVALCTFLSVSAVSATITVSARPTSAAQQGTSGFHIVPFPTQLTPKTGAFLLSASTVIAVSPVTDAELGSLAEYGREMIRTALGLDLDRLGVPTGNAGSDAILLILDPSEIELSNEGYRLTVTPNSVRISAPAHAGLFYGLQTLRQLLPPNDRSVETAETWTIPAVEIVDRPRFIYRGMHLDVGRHFFPVEFVKKYIDLLAMYKMNTFHWHLTEDQGWRIEIEEYPALTEVGAYRKETILARNFDPYIGDRKPYGGYYTQDEIREVVEHARRRYVNVIPEIEMPGHSLAALAAYPELACTEGPFEVATVWGVHEDIYCPSERTFTFLEHVLTEVMGLFPSSYIHIGGDEAPKARWESSQLAQEVMRREGLADENELQSYFIRRIEPFLLAHDRRLIGWDEILEGGLAPQATVMSWRGTAGGIEAAKQGHDVIMTPTSHVYFDYYQGDPLFEPLAIGGYTPLEKVYGFEPVPEELTPEEAQHILGAQGNVWTEYMTTTSYVEYMILPRMLALAEVVWSAEEARDWNRFVRALPDQLRYLDAQRLTYRIPHVRGLERDRLTLDETIIVTLHSLIPEADIRFTTDQSDPSRSSTLYTGPVELAVDEHGTRVTARAFLRNGKASPARAARFARTSLRSAADVDPDDLETGLQFSYYEARISSVRELQDRRSVREGVARAVGLQGFERPEAFGVVFRGFIRVPSSDVYTFVLTSDDGSELVIGDDIVVDNDGFHGPLDQIGSIALEAGYHPITVRYFQAGGGRTLSLTMIADDEESVDLDGWLFHPR
jgi:hexosaminidase